MPSEREALFDGLLDNMTKTAEAIADGDLPALANGLRHIWIEVGVKLRQAKEAARKAGLADQLDE
jgi:hypothetical protein